MQRVNIKQDLLNPLNPLTILGVFRVVKYPKGKRNG